MNSGRDHTRIDSHDAGAIEIDRDTFTKHFADKLARGTARTTARLIESLIVAGGSTGTAKFLLTNLIIHVPMSERRRSRWTLGKMQRTAAVANLAQGGWKRLVT